MKNQNDINDKKIKKNKIKIKNIPLDFLFHALFDFPLGDRIRWSGIRGAETIGHTFLINENKRQLQERKKENINYNKIIILKLFEGQTAKWRTIIKPTENQ